VVAGIVWDEVFVVIVSSMFGGSTVGSIAFPVMAGRDGVDIRCDLALICVGAVSREAGYTTSNLAEASMMSEMMNRATQVVVMADASKVGRRLFAQVGDLGRADWFVSDTPPPDDLAKALQVGGVEVVTGD